MRDATASERNFAHWHSAGATAFVSGKFPAAMNTADGDLIGTTAFVSGRFPAARNTADGDLAGASVFIFGKYGTIYMIPGSKGQKFDASLLAGGFLTLGPVQNMSKYQFFEEK